MPFRTIEFAFCILKSRLIRIHHGVLPYFLFCALVFVAFCIHHPVKLIKRLPIFIIEKLRWIQVDQLLLKKMMC